VGIFTPKLAPINEKFWISSAYHYQHTGTPQEVEAAIQAGADVNAKDGGGMTPLMYAAQYNNNSEVLNVLIKVKITIQA